jgi:hypothetical protein
LGFLVAAEILRRRQIVGRTRPWAVAAGIRIPLIQDKCYPGLDLDPRNTSKIEIRGETYISKKKFTLTARPFIIFPLHETIAIAAFSCESNLFHHGKSNEI